MQRPATPRHEGDRDPPRSQHHHAVQKRKKKSVHKSTISLKLHIYSIWSPSAAPAPPEASAAPEASALPAASGL